MPTIFYQKHFFFIFTLEKNLNFCSGNLLHWPCILYSLLQRAKSISNLMTLKPNLNLRIPNLNLTLIATYNLTPTSKNWRNMSKNHNGFSLRMMWKVWKIMTRLESAVGMFIHPWTGNYIISLNWSSILKTLLLVIYKRKELLKCCSRKSSTINLGTYLL